MKTHFIDYSLRHVITGTTHCLDGFVFRCSLCRIGEVRRHPTPDTMKQELRACPIYVTLTSFSS
eukprot:scaffold42574_cov65-Attheya_sp.AAC.2